MDLPHKLFSVDANGVIRLNRKLTDLERTRSYSLNVTATDAQGKQASTIVNVFVEANLIALPSSSSSVPPTFGNESDTQTKQLLCNFLSKTFNAEIGENLPGRHKLIQLKSNCSEGQRVAYLIHQATGRIFFAFS